MDNLDDNEYKEEDKKLDDVINHYLDDLYNNISTTDNTISNENEKKDLSNNYSDLDKTISKFKQIQVAHDSSRFQKSIWKPSTITSFSETSSTPTVMLTSRYWKN